MNIQTTFELISENGLEISTWKRRTVDALCTKRNDPSHLPMPSTIKYIIIIGGLMSYEIVWSTISMLRSNIEFNGL